VALFSSPPPLAEDVKGAVSPFFFLDEVGRRDQKQGLAKLATSQEAITSALRSGEQLVVIVPCFAQNTGYDGLCVVTSERILHIKGRRVTKEMNRSDLADVIRMATPSGHFLLQFVSRAAAPFAPFAHGDLRNQGTMKFWTGTIQVALSTSELLEDLAAKAQP
jgi:hypothetical protein